MTGGYGPALRQISRLFNGGAVAGLESSELLERFATTRDEAAFEALIHQHGPMVLGTCRRMLIDPHDVEDAFQATFLVLARRAGSIQDADRLGPWLHGVARRVASRSRALSARRNSLEKAEIREPSTEPFDTLEAAERRSALDEELSRLPEKYRAPLILCYLEGLTHDEAARKLRWPVGTVRSRLAGGRDRLRDRLTRRGLAPTSAVPLVMARAAIPPTLLSTTVRIATSAGLGSSHVATLAKGVLAVMIWNKLKVVGALGLMTALTVGGAGIASQQGEAGKVQAEKKAVVPTAGADHDGESKADVFIGADEKNKASDKVQAVTKPEDELAKLQGEWKLTKIRPANDDLDDLTFGMTLTFVGKISTTKSRDGKPFSRNVIVLGEEGDRKTIDFRNIQDVADDKTADRCLYRIDGDTLEICSGNPGGPMPTEFKASDDRPYPVICTYKRQPIEGPANAAIQRLEKQLAEQQATIKLLQEQLDGKNRPSTKAKAVVAEDEEPKVATPMLMQLGEGWVVSIPIEKDRVTVLNTETGFRTTHRFSSKLTELLPVWNGTLAFSLEGPEVRQILAFSFLEKKWFPQDLKEPVTQAMPVVDAVEASYELGRFLYIFNRQARKWSTLELKRGQVHDIPWIFDQQTGRRTCQEGTILHTYDPKTGDWTDFDTDGPDNVNPTAPASKQGGPGPGPGNKSSSNGPASGGQKITDTKPGQLQKPKSPQKVFNLGVDPPIYALVEADGSEVTFVDAGSKTRSTLARPAGSRASITPTATGNGLFPLSMIGDISRLAVFDRNVRRWSVLELKDPLQNATVQSSFGVIAFSMVGPKMTQVMVFSPFEGNWSMQDLKEPTSKHIQPVFYPHIVVYPIGRFCYTYSALANKWSTLELKQAFDWDNFNQKFPIQEGKITIPEEQAIHIYDAKTGEWTHIETKDEK